MNFGQIISLLGPLMILLESGGNTPPHEGSNRRLGWRMGLKGDWQQEVATARGYHPVNQPVSHINFNNGLRLFLLLLLFR